MIKEQSFNNAYAKSKLWKKLWKPPATYYITIR